MDQIAQREYRPGDWQAMHALDLVCFAPPFRFSRATMRAYAQAPGAVTILAEAAGELAGFCVAHLEQKMGYVVTLDVAPSRRRQGLAGRLMAEVETRILTAGGTGMELHVFTGNEDAVRFYEGIGYRRAAMAKNFYGRGLDALLYRKRL